jgi:hypothetical protein
MSVFFSEWYVPNKIRRKSQKTQFMLNNLFPKIVSFMRQFRKRRCSQTGHRWQHNTAKKMRFASRGNKGKNTDTHSWYLIFIAFVRQDRLSERVTMYLDCVRTKTKCSFTWMLMTDVSTKKNLADIVAIYGRGRELSDHPGNTY